MSELQDEYFVKNIYTYNRSYSHTLSFKDGIAIIGDPNDTKNTCII